MEIFQQHFLLSLGHGDGCPVRHYQNRRITFLELGYVMPVDEVRMVHPEKVPLSKEAFILAQVSGDEEPFPV